VKSCLQAKQRKVQLQFDTLSDQTLVKALQKGAFLLSISFLAENGRIFFEQAEKPARALCLTIDQLKNIFLERAEEIGHIEIIVLQTSRGKAVASAVQEMIASTNEALIAKRKQLIVEHLRLLRMQDQKEEEGLVEEEYQKTFGSQDIS